MISKNPAAPPAAFLPFHKPSFGPEELGQLSEALESGWLTRGPKTQQFEDMFRRYIGSTSAVGVNSATAGLHLALVCLGIGAGDEVITTPITYCATPNEIEHAGATPVFADIDPVTWLIDPASVEAKITPRTKAIMPVHLYGQSCDMDALGAIAKRHNLKIIEDAAHAIETTWRDRKIGTIGDFTVFSFYPTKNISTGEGGMMTTMDHELGEYARRMSMHGNSKDAWKRYGSSGFAHYSLLERGYKYHMFDLLAALGIAQLPKLEAWWERRRGLWLRYDELLAGIAAVRAVPVSMPGRHAHHLYVVELNEALAGLSRDAVMDGMQKRNVGVGIHYYGMHLQPYYMERYGLDETSLPVATHASKSMLTLPLYPLMEQTDVESVVAALRQTLSA
ncbi:MAG: DegT/DnrJ/EryC1/StrS family aminotransferase [Candidatus Velthaea sp.]